MNVQPLPAAKQYTPVTDSAVTGNTSTYTPLTPFQLSGDGAAVNVVLTVGAGGPLTSLVLESGPAGGKGPWVPLRADADFDTATALIPDPRAAAANGSSITSGFSTAAAGATLIFPLTAAGCYRFKFKGGTTLTQSVG